MGGIQVPKLSGQSGTAMPEPVLVTMAPAKMTKAAKTAVATA
jgi:hypothetical protein